MNQSQILTIRADAEKMLQVAWCLLNFDMTQRPHQSQSGTSGRQLNCLHQNNALVDGVCRRLVGGAAGARIGQRRALGVAVVVGAGHLRGVGAAVVRLTAAAGKHVRQTHPVVDVTSRSVPPTCSAQLLAV